jgi:2-keto-3-deoxy-L-rhamnonate aldolase RhmA
MRTLLSLAAALVINVAAFAAFDWSAHDAQRAPAGVVTVTQLPVDVHQVLYAQARNGSLL